MAGRGLRISIDGLEALGADLSKLEPPGLQNIVRDSLKGGGGKALVTEMRNTVPRRTGQLYSGIRVEAEPGEDVLIGYVGERAYSSLIANAREQRGVWVESGTRPHTIKAKNAESLFFAGRNIEQVEHPGQKGQGIARRAIRTAEWEVLADIVDRIDAKLSGGIGHGN